MNPVKFEIIAVDKSKPGTDSAGQNVDVLSTKIEQQKAVLESLQMELKKVQNAASKGAGMRTVEDVVMVDKLQKKINELQITLKELEMQKKQTSTAPIISTGTVDTMDKAIQRSNNLSYSVQQVARELPSLAMGPQMFFLAISNNLPILQDQLRLARQEYNALAAAGQKGVPVWKQVTSSIFSWQTALVAGITLLVMNGKAIGEWMSNLGKSRKEIDANRIAVENLSSARSKGATSAQAELTRLRLLYKATQDDTLAKGERNKAVDELQRKYPSYFGNLSNEAILAGKAATKYTALSKAILAAAKAREYEDKIVENEKEILKAKDERMGAMVESVKAQKDAEASTALYNQLLKDKAPLAQLQLVASQVASATTRIGEYGKKAEEATSKIDALNKVNKRLSSEINPSDLLFNDEKNPVTTKPVEPINDTDLIGDAQIKADKRIEEMRLAIMADSYKKRKLEAQLQFVDEINRIAEEERERLAQLEKARKSGLRITPQQVNGVTDQANTQRGLAKDVLSKKLSEIADEEYKTLTAKYQSYTDKRLGIERQYNEDLRRLIDLRTAAQESGDKQAVDALSRSIAQAMASKGKDTMKLDFEQLTESPEYVRAFEDLRNTGTETLEALMSELQKYKVEAGKNMDPESLREYSLTLQEIIDELESRDIFGVLAQRREELAQAESELAEAQANLGKVQNGGQIVNGAKMDPKSGKLSATYMNEQQALDQVTKAKDKYTKANNNMAKAEKRAKDVVNELCEALKEVGSIIGGQAGEIISLIGEIGQFAMMAMSGVSSASSTASASVKAVEKASVILAIIGAALQIAMKIANMFKEDDGVAAYEKAKKTYESYINILDRVIEKQKELFNLNSDNGKAAYEQAKKLLSDSADTARELGKQYLNAGASHGFLGMGSSASHGVAQNDNISDKAWAQAKAALGSDFYNYGIGDGRMTGLFNLPIELIQKLQKDALLFYSELDDDTRKYLDRLLEVGDKLDAIEHDRMTGLVSIDLESFSSGYLDMLNDLDMSNKDFADKFEDYIKNALLSSIITTKYKGQIDKLYEDWALATDSDNQLTPDEAAKLKKRQQELADALLKEREEMYKTFGFKKDSAEQSAQRGMINGVTEETASKLDGSIISQTNRLISVDETLVDIMQLLDRALGPIMSIAENTKRAAELLEMIQTDISTVRRDGVTIRN